LDNDCFGNKTYLISAISLIDGEGFRPQRAVTIRLIDQDTNTLSRGISTSVDNLFYRLIGAIVGTLIGFLPGMGPIAGVALPIPAAFSLCPTFAIIMLAGISYGINVNGVAPHAIETDMSAEWPPEKRKAIIEAIPLKRLGRTEDLAEAVLFLAPDKAAFITGEILDVNGGFIMD
jgi:hypothetical protein